MRVRHAHAQREDYGLRTQKALRQASAAGYAVAEDVTTLSVEVLHDPQRRDELVEAGHACAERALAKRNANGAVA